MFIDSRIFEESIVSLSEARKLFPVKVSPSLLERWVRKGTKNGIYLGIVWIGERRHTSKEGIARFLSESNPTSCQHTKLPSTPTSPVNTDKPVRNIPPTEVEKELRRLGIKRGD